MSRRREPDHSVSGSASRGSAMPTASKSSARGAPSSRTIGPAGAAAGGDPGAAAGGGFAGVASPGVASAGGGAAGAAPGLPSGCGSEIGGGVSRIGPPCACASAGSAAATRAASSALARQAITGDGFFDALGRRRQVAGTEDEDPAAGDEQQQDENEDERMAEKTHRRGRHQREEAGLGGPRRGQRPSGLLHRPDGDFKALARAARRPRGVGVSEHGLPPDRSVVLVGLMGAGKSAIGRRLAQRVGLPFVDADHEIEAAAGCTIEEIFARFGEPAFRDGERKVIARLLDRPPMVLATGGGAFMDPDTRARVRSRAVSVWLRADLDVLVRRVARRGNRPLLKQGTPREVLERLMALRHPVYAEADITVDTDDSPAEATVERVIDALAGFANASRAVEAAR